MMKPEKEEENPEDTLMETKVRKLNDRDQSKSINLPPLMKAFATIKQAKYIEMRTFRDKKGELYLEVRLIKGEEGEKQNAHQ